MALQNSNQSGNQETNGFQHAGTLIDGLLETVAKVQANQPFETEKILQHEHTCSKCGSVCFCDEKLGCNEDDSQAVCNACTAWAEGRA